MSDATPITPARPDDPGTSDTFAQARPLAASAFAYSLFLSYSTDPDYGLARALEGALETFHQLPTPNELELPALAVCVDGSDFHSAKATDVEGAIREHLAKCERLLVLCSKNAGSSGWVDREIRWFIETRGRDHVLIALTDGVDFDSAAKTFPKPLLESKLDKQIAYDLRGFRRAGRRATAVRDFDDELTRLAADLYGKSASEIRPVWFRAQQRKARQRVQLLTTVAIALVALLAVAVYFYIASETQRKRALEEAARTRQQLYVASVNFARRALDDGLIPVARQLLEAQVPLPDQQDLRDFDWFYLMGRTNVLRSRWPGDETTMTTVSVSADGSLVAASGRSSRPSIDMGAREVPQPVYLWSAATGTRRLLVGHQKNVHAVVFSPTGSTLVSSDDDELIVWDTQAATVSKRIRLPYGAAGLAFSFDGRRLAATSGAAITIFDTATWTEVSRLVAFPDQHVFSLSFSPDGSELAGGGLDKIVHIWNVATRQPVATLRGHDDKILSVAWSSRNVLATGSRDGTVIVWDRTNERTADSIEHPDGAGALAFSPDGTLLAVGLGDPATLGTRKAIQLWDVDGRTPRGTIKGHSGRVDALAFGPDGQALYSTGEDDAVLVWDIAQARALSVVEAGESTFWSVAFSRDGGRVAMGDNEGRIRLRSSNETGTAVTVRAAEDDSGSPDALGQRISELSFDDAGSLVALDGRGAVHRLEFGASPSNRVVFQSDRLLTSAQVSPKGTHLAASHCNQQILLGPWPASTPMSPMPTAGCPTFVAWAADGRRFLSGGGSPVNASPATIFLWELGVAAPIRELKGLGTWPTAAAFSPDGTQVAAGDWDGQLVIWNAATGRAEHTIGAHTDLIAGVAYSPSGKVIATASEDKTVRLWDASTGQERTLFEHGNMQFRALAFSPSGRSLIAVGSADDYTHEGRAVTWSVPANR